MENDPSAVKCALLLPAMDKLIRVSKPVVRYKPVFVEFLKPIAGVLAPPSEKNTRSGNSLFPSPRICVEAVLLLTIP